MLVQEPDIDLFEDQEFYRVIDLLNSSYLNKGIEVLFYNYYCTPESELAKHNLNVYTNCKHFSCGLEFYDWIWSNKPWDELVKINKKLMAEKLYLYLKQEIIPIDYYNSKGNIAPGQTVFASTSENNWGWHTKNLTDGIRTSYWVHRGWQSFGPENEKSDHTEWIVIKLDDKYMIDGINLIPRNDFEEKYALGLPADFTIQFSTDSTDRHTVVEKKGFPKPEKNTISSFDIMPRIAKYIKVEGTKLLKEKYFEGNLYRMSFSEIEIIGQKKK